MVHGPPGKEDTVDISGKREEFLRERLEQRLYIGIEDKLRPLHGSLHQEAGERIKAGTHTIDDVYEYHARLKALLLEGRSPNPDVPGGYAYSDLAGGVVELIVSDFDACLRKGETYRRAVKRYLNLIGKTDERDVETFLGGLCSDLRKVLYGSVSELPYPELLASLWELKILRPTTYAHSLDALKWIQLISHTINHINAENKDIKVRVDTQKMFIAGVMNYGMLHPKIPLVENSDRKLSDEERTKLNEHGQVGIVMLKNNGMPGSEYLTSVVGCHNLALGLISGIAAVGEGFEAMYFKRRYRKERLEPLEVFKRLGYNLFGEAPLNRILKDLRIGGYRAKQAENPLRQPYQMLGLVFGILEHLEKH